MFGWTPTILLQLRVHRFPLALAGQGKLWYQCIYPFQGNWEESQERFRTPFSKIGNIRKQLSHAGRSFHFNENEETINASVQRIRQVAVILNYGELQTVAVGTTKRILTKEKSDRQ